MTQERWVSKRAAQAKPNLNKLTLMLTQTGDTVFVRTVHTTPDFKG